MVRSGELSPTTGTVAATLSGDTPSGDMPPGDTPPGDMPGVPGGDSADDRSVAGAEGGSGEEAGEEPAMESPSVSNFFDSLTHSLLKVCGDDPAINHKPCCDSLLSPSPPSLSQWQELSPQHTPDDVPQKLLVLAQVILAYKPLSQSLSEAATFFREPMTLLMTYSTEGES